MLALLKQSNRENLASSVDSLIATDKTIGTLDARLAQLAKWKNRRKKPWDLLRWKDRASVVEGRVEFRKASLLMSAGRIMDAERAAAQAVKLDGSEDTYRMLATVLQAEEYPSEALGALLTGWCLTGDDRLNVSAKQLYLGMKYPEDEWESYAQAFKDSYLTMLLQSAQRRAKSGSSLALPGSCMPKNLPENAAGVVLIWDVAGGEPEASILRELNLMLTSNDIPHSFCYAGIDINAGKQAAKDWGLGFELKKRGIRGTRLESAGIRSLPAAVVIHGNDTPLLLSDSGKLLPQLVQRALETMNENRPVPSLEEMDDE